MLPDGYSLRLAVAEDAPALTDARLAMINELTPDEAGDLAAFRDRIASFFRRAIAEGAARAFVVERGGAIAATGAYCLAPHPPKPAEPAEQRAFVVNVWTRPEDRRRGLARALMRALLDDARVRGVRRVDLRSSEAARPLYLSLGFRPLEMMRLEF